MVPSLLPLGHQSVAVASGRPWPDDQAAADCRGQRIGILIVAYNALTTLLPVLQPHHAKRLAQRRGSRGLRRRQHGRDVTSWPSA